MDFPRTLSAATFVAALVLVGLGIRSNSRDCETNCSDTTIVDVAAHQRFSTGIAAFQARVPATQSKPAFAACFAPGTPDKVQAAMISAMRARGWQDYHVPYSWNGGVGKPVTLTYSLVPDGTSIQGYIGEPVSPSNMFATLDAQYASQGGRAAWIRVIDAAYARWGQLTGIKFVRTQSGSNDWDDGADFETAEGEIGVRGDIRIAGHYITGPGGVLAYNFYPDPGTGYSGNMVIDTGDSWGNPANGFRFFRNVLVHEAGHGIGIAHSCPVDNQRVMQPFLTTAIDAVQQDDLRAAMQNYGDILELSGSTGGSGNGPYNDTIADPSDLGSLDAGQVQQFGVTPPDSQYPTMPIPLDTATLSLGSNDTSDFYQVYVSTPGIVDVTVTPIGSSYLAGQQNDNGSCQAGSLTNAAAQSDISLRAISPNKVTSLAFANATGAGSSESLTFTAASAGTYYVHVKAETSADVQLYQLTLGRTKNLIQGAVSLQNYVGSVESIPLEVEVFDASDDSLLLASPAYPNSSGQFAVQALTVPGVNAYVRVKPSHWLSRRSSNFLWDANAETVSFSPFLNGDVDGDNVVSIFDYIELSDAFDATRDDDHWNENADLDGDGVVSVFDYIILSDQFDLEGE